jgi:hypothetical protein
MVVSAMIIVSLGIGRKVKPTPELGDLGEPL